MWQWRFWHIVSPAARLRELSADRIVQEILRATPAPGGDFRQTPVEKQKSK